MYNRSTIAKEAHRVARIYRGSVPYRRALSWGFREAWQQAKAIAEVERRDTAMTPTVRARRDEAILIQCNSDRLTPADYTRLNELSRAA